MKARLAGLMLAWLLPLSAGSTARFALLVGNDEGASGRPRLWYASQDARLFAATLTELGDFPKDQVVVLENARVDVLRRELAAMEARVAVAQKGGERGLLLFYFSGHANATALELGSDEFPFEELRKTLLASPSNARIAVVDTCGAGALTQVKGGRAASSVDFVIPSGDAVEGVAFLASTAVGEQAQESTVIQGSFFTSHLEAAMRGAGDLDGDGRVTLTEAFFYTSSHTILDTARTEAGAQHPTYDTHLSGRGDVVLADLRKAEATLTLPAANGATWMIHGPSRFFAEVPGGTAPTRIALGAATYTVERVDGEYGQSVDVALDRGDSKELPALSPRRLTSGASKGGRGVNEVSIGMSLSSGLMLHAGGAFGGRVSVTHAVGPVRLRGSLDAGREGVTDAGLNYNLTVAGAAAALLVPVVWTPGRIELGAQGGAEWMYQQRESDKSLQAVSGHGEAVLLLSLPVGAFRLGTELTSGLQCFRLNGHFVNRFFASGAVVAGTEF